MEDNLVLYKDFFNKTLDFINHIEDGSKYKNHIVMGFIPPYETDKGLWLSQITTFKFVGYFSMAAKLSVVMPVLINISYKDGVCSIDEDFYCGRSSDFVRSAFDTCVRRKHIELALDPSVSPDEVFVDFTKDTHAAETEMLHKMAIIYTSRTKRNPRDTAAQFNMANSSRAVKPHDYSN